MGGGGGGSGVRLATQFLSTRPRSIAELATERVQELPRGLKTLGAGRIAATLEDGVVGIRIKRPGHDGLSAFLFGGAEAVGSLASFDSIHDEGNPIHVSGARAAATVETAGDQEQPAIIGGLLITRMHLAVVINGSLRRQRRIGPAVPEDELAILALERGKVGTRGIEIRRGQASVALEIGKVVLGVIPIGIIEDEVLEDLSTKGKGEVGNVIFGQRRTGASQPGDPLVRVAFGRRSKPGIDRPFLVAGALVNRRDRLALLAR